jgi:DNA-binding phage protein
VSKSTILKHTLSYHDELVESLKNPKEAESYLRVALEEYQEDRDSEALFLALRNIAEARDGLKQPAK